MKLLEEVIVTRENRFRYGEEITRRLGAINSLEKRTKKQGLFKDQREELQKKLQELRKRL